MGDRGKKMKEEEGGRKIIPGLKRIFRALPDVPLLA
jgi:hypothetical protein